MSVKEEAVKKLAEVIFDDNRYDGFVVFGRRKDTDKVIKKLFSKRVTELSSSEFPINPRSNLYIGNNIVKHPQKWSGDEVFAYKSVVLDIDAHDSLKKRNNFDNERDYLLQWNTIEDETDIILWNIRHYKLPEPNLIIFSGRGIQLWFGIITMAAGYEDNDDLYDGFRNALYGLYKHMMEEISGCKFNGINMLTLDQIASKKKMGFYRLPGSYNTMVKNKKYNKSRIEVFHKRKLLRSDMRKVIEEYKELIIEEEQEDLSQAIPLEEDILGEDTISVPDKRYISLLRKRTAFIEWLIKHRDAPAGRETRKRMLFQLHNACLQYMSKEIADEKVREVNKLFKRPLGHISNIINEKKTYKYKLNRFYNSLDVKEDEIKEFNKWFNPKPRNYTRDTARRTKKENRNAEILRLHKGGKRMVEIASITGVSRQTISKIIKNAT